MQFLIVVVILNRKLPFVRLSELIISSILSLFLIGHLFVKLKSLKYVILNVLLISTFSTFIVLNADRIVASDYYMILFKYEREMKNVVNSDTNSAELLKQVKELKGCSNFEDVTFFYFEWEHPPFSGVAYSVASEKSKHTSVGL